VGREIDPFATIAGHTQALDQLRSQLSSARLSHAYLFVGEAGLGKAEIANIARQRPANQDNANPATRAALEEIRRELIEVRGLLDELMRRPKLR